MTQPKWHEVAFHEGDFQLRFDVIGLSDDGRMCFAIYTDNSNPTLFSIDTQRVIGYLTDPFDVPRHVEISSAQRQRWDWLAWAEANQSGDHVHIRKGPARGRYRLFGANLDHPLLVNPKSGIEVVPDEEAHQVILRSASNTQEIQRLDYRWFSSGWVSATFSDDGSTLAVVEPLYVTFYRQLP